jgi:hypothetical protein
MVDQTIIEKHLKQIREHVVYGEAICNHIEDHMLPPYHLNINQVRHITDFLGVARGLLIAISFEIAFL